MDCQKVAAGFRRGGEDRQGTRQGVGMKHSGVCGAWEGPGGGRGREGGEAVRGGCGGMRRG